VLSVEDNGSGFVQSGREGFGLQSMRERAQAVGGRLVVTSTSGRGTSVHFSLAPFKQASSSGRQKQTRRSQILTPTRRVTRVLVVDDHPLYREAVSHLLEQENDIRVVGQVGSAQEAIAAAKRLQPDVVLLDVALSDASGIEVARQLGTLGLGNAPAVLMVSAFPDSGQVVRAMKAGARGYVTKTIDGQSLLSSIRAVARGATILDAASGSDLWGPRALAQLTRRELDVLRLVAEGKTNSEIADELFLAKKTVERIVASATARLRARNRAHAVAKAVALKLLDVRS
jgi:DNA-binding NarL/FixJ family response regulator